jgi:hypothetical protein
MANMPSEPKPRPDSFWLGYDSRGVAFDNGHHQFYVYSRANQFYWVVVDDDLEPAGPEQGPYSTAKEAHYAALN